MIVMFRKNKLMLIVIITAVLMILLVYWITERMLANLEQPAFGMMNTLIVLFHNI
jgi:hypothetical protein